LTNGAGNGRAGCNGESVPLPDPVRWRVRVLRDADGSPGSVMLCPPAEDLPDGSLLVSSCHFGPTARPAR
jgi:hypothetical protein